MTNMSYDVPVHNCGSDTIDDIYLENVRFFCKIQDLDNVHFYIN